MSLTDTTAMYANLTDLIPNTTYQYRAFAVLSYGDTLLGTIKTFTTLPISIINTATNITQTKAKLNSTLTLGDAIATIKGFKYKQNSSSTYETVSGIMSLTDTTAMYANLTDLIPNTTYQYRAFAVLSYGDTLLGTIKTFTTLPVVITTNTATDITQTKAQLNSTLTFGDATAT